MRLSNRGGMPNTLTTSEAAELVGLTPKAIKNRLDRGQLQYVLKAGRRRIPVAELVRAELLDAEAGGPLLRLYGARRTAGLIRPQTGPQTAPTPPITPT